MNVCEEECAMRVQAGVNEEMEQRRRLLDKSGEGDKKLLAKQISRLIPRYSVLNHVPAPVERKFLILQEETVDLEFEKSNLLNQGWEAIKKAAEAVTNATYVSADVVTQAAVDAMEKVGARTAEMMSQIGHTTTDIMDKTGNAAIQLGHRTSDVVEQLVDKTSHAASSVAHTTSDMASQWADKTAQAAHNTSDAAQHLGHQIVDTGAQVATSIAHSDVAHKATEMYSQVVDISANAASKLGHKVEETVHKIQDFTDEVYNSSTMSDVTKLYVRAQETVEQARRMASGEEQCALLNAMFVSSLIQDLGISFYKQTGVNKWYGIKLLENMEMKWRLFHELDGYAVTNAKKEARLISQWFASKGYSHVDNTPQQTEGLPFKIAVVELTFIAPDAPSTAAQ